jgi:glyoxylase-like metal-dependent hydrolase (beta-lactamase superfamily II)
MTSPLGLLARRCDTERVDVQPIVMPLQLPVGVMGPNAVEVDVRAFLVRDAGRTILIDTGMQQDGAHLDTALDDAGVSWSDISDVVLTHHHPDHIGALGHVIEKAPRATVHSGDALPNVEAAHDGDRIGSLRVLATPGHTPGHICLVDETSGDVFTGDCVGIFGGQLQPAPAVFTADAERAAQSLRDLAAVRGRRMYFSHGPEMDHPWDALANLLDR